MATRLHGRVALAGAAAFALGAAAADVLAAPWRAPDLSFDEVQVTYPRLNLSVRIVPAGGPAATSVLRLRESAKPEGTVLTAPLPSGQMGEIAVRSCEHAQPAQLRVWLRNRGAAAYAAHPSARRGLTGHLAQRPVRLAIGAVPARSASQYRLVPGPFALRAGHHRVALTLNPARGGGESNFHDNVFEEAFEIRCARNDDPPS